jgi:teichuronic acid biosynthesis glycosyltransferase TuaC
MRVLIVYSGATARAMPGPPKPFENKKPFVYEQMEELKQFGIKYEVFEIKEGGLLGYLKYRKKLTNMIRFSNYNIIHAHSGMPGMLATSQFKIPVLITFLGTDINDKRLQIISRLAMVFSKHNIFMSRKQQKKVKMNKNHSIIPFGIDLNNVRPEDKTRARMKMGLRKEHKICLFGSSKYRKVKNFSLAEKAVELCKNVKLIFLHGHYKREEVISLINAADCIILTSLSEGSPQIIKEAMACNRPIVATDVGDIKELIKNTEGCYITSFDPKNVAENIQLAIDFSLNNGTTYGREKIKHLDNKIISKKIYKIYKSI